MIGDNGSGKSTLLRLLTNPSLVSRKVLSANGTKKIVMLSQNPFLGFAEKSIADFLRASLPHESDAYLIDKVADSLGLKVFDHSRLLSCLSGGERQRVAILSLLIQEPDLLLFDEPTNHLDEDFHSWVVEFISRLEIPFVLVSHDRRLLDAVVDEIWFLKDGELEHYSGNYSAFKAFKDSERERIQHEYDHRRSQIKKLEKAQRDIKARALSLNRYKGPEKKTNNGRIIGPRKPYGHGKDIGFCLMQKAVALETRILKKIGEEKSAVPNVEKRRKLVLDADVRKTKQLVQLTDVSLERADRKLFSNLNLTLSTGESLLLTGPNASGKTSLLEIIMGELEPSAGKRLATSRLNVAYLRQNPVAPKEFQTVKDYMESLDKEDQQLLWRQLGRLKFPPEAFALPFDDLSPGEFQKFCLSQVLNQNSQLIVLDEPTNHLEIASREALEQVLVQTQKSLIVTTHDVYLQKALQQKERTTTMILRT